MVVTSCNSLAVVPFESGLGSFDLLTTTSDFLRIPPEVSNSTSSEIPGI